MHRFNYIYVVILFFAIVGTLNAQETRTLTLDDCRQLAIKNNKELKISKTEVRIAEWQRKAAKTNYYPKFSALGTYMRNEKEISLLSEEQKHSLSSLGTATAPKLQQFGMLFAQKYPHLAPVIQDIGKTLGGQLVPALDGLGSSLVNGLRTDTRNLFVGAVNVTQPIFVGGKIRAYNHITEYAKEIAENKDRLSTQEVLLQTDQAYWLVVSLSNKKKLADSYVKLLQKMDSDVEKMIKEGVATKADGLTVKVKVNEAEMLQTKANNGLSLAKMALCQICGLELDTPIALTYENKDHSAYALDGQTDSREIEIAMQHRPELQSLNLASLAKKEKEKIERSEFLPQVAFTGNYLVTNPSSFDGFENKFGGMWTLGLQVKVPIWHWREGHYKVNKAKAETEIIAYKLEEAKEKITLQVRQARFKINEAQKQLEMAYKNVDKAKENLRYAQLGFKEGVIPPSNVLQAHTAWFDAKAEQIDAKIALKMSQVVLEKALGTLSIKE